MSEDTEKLQRTRRIDSVPPRRPPPRQPQRGDNPFRLPLWSVVLMVMLVLATAFCMVGLLIALGGRTAPGGEPRIVMITASPLATLAVEEVAAAATLPPTVQRPTVVFRLEGPTLPPPAITPTPQNIAIGKTVKVIDVGDQQLNVRATPGVIGTEVVFRIPEGQLLTVVEGPQQADGLTWWQIQTSGDKRGWAAANYLEVVSQ